MGFYFFYKRVAFTDQFNTQILKLIKDLDKAKDGVNELYRLCPGSTYDHDATTLEEKIQHITTMLRTSPGKIETSLFNPLLEINTFLSPRTQTTSEAGIHDLMEKMTSFNRDFAKQKDIVTIYARFASVEDRITQLCSECPGVRRDLETLSFEEKVIFLKKILHEKNPKYQTTFLDLAVTLYDTLTSSPQERTIPAVFKVLAVVEQGLDKIQSILDPYSDTQSRLIRSFVLSLILLGCILCFSPESALSFAAISLVTNLGTYRAHHIIDSINVEIEQERGAPTKDSYLKGAKALVSTGAGIVSGSNPYVAIPAFFLDQALPGLGLVLQLGVVGANLSGLTDYLYKVKDYLTGSQGMYELLGENGPAISQDFNDKFNVFYKTIMLKLHPDKLPQTLTAEVKEACERCVVELNNARELLGDKQIDLSASISPFEEELISSLNRYVKNFGNCTVPEVLALLPK